MARSTSLIVALCLVLHSTCLYGKTYTGEIGSCKGGCSGQGVCSEGGRTQTHEQCDCFPGFHGVDCSLRLCPAARAWVDFPYADDSAHREFTECSNMGSCNRKTGNCECREGFGGPACDVMLCPADYEPLSTYFYKTTSATAQTIDSQSPNRSMQYKKVCSGKGRCMSLRGVSTYQDYITYFDYKDYSDWDADMIHGCVCDPGWEGPACNRRSCPKGVDPLDTSESSTNYETQLIECRCQQCSGGVNLTFRGETTPMIKWNADIVVIKHFLSNLPSIQQLEVSFLYGNQLCSNGPYQSVLQVKIKEPYGSLPEIVATASNKLVTYTLGVKSGGESAVVGDFSRYYSQSGNTRAAVECSNRGSCDYLTGTCSCFENFRSSDGRGGEGTRGDCGYKHADNHTYYVAYNGSYTYSVQTACPFFNDAVCSGHGTCEETTGKCACDDGYGGGACYNMTCGTTNSWFGDVANHTASSVCAGVGLCNGTDGTCYDCGGGYDIYYGDQCQYLSCYGYEKYSDGSGECSGNGVCLSLREMAALSYAPDKTLAGYTYTEPWDADMIRGCACSRARSVDNKFYSAYQIEHKNTYYMNTTLHAQEANYLAKYYRGPYAFAATNYKGFNCQSSMCPTGDNPKTFNQFNEVQVLECSATNGTFTLTFRGNTTLPISYNATSVELKLALEQLYTIREVDVTIDNVQDFDGVENRNVTICSKSNSYRTNTYIEFSTEHGDLPLLIADSSLSSSDKIPHVAAHLRIAEYRAGNKEDVECSGNGLCDESTGICKCAVGYISSNGTLNAAGETGDCSYRNQFYPFL